MAASGSVGTSAPPIAVLRGIPIASAVAAIPGSRAVTSFFGAAGHPLNLAILRITIFLGLLLLFDRNEVLWFAELPKTLQFAPGFLDRVIRYLPIDAPLVSVVSTVFVISCVCAMLGLFTRVSTWVAVICGLYVLGIPQFYGKVNHYHHLLWFAAILAASRCGDAFSIDAVRAAWQRADRGVTDPPGPARAYRLPICFILLLIGLVYFFPGFWKIALVGPDWAFSDNLRFMMYEKWTELDGWLPFFPIDQYPPLYQAAAAGTILFEVGFIFLLFTRLRPLLFFAGLAFHNLTNLFMMISFWSLQLCYVALVDWHGLLARLGRHLFPAPMYVLYDGDCKLCRRTVASLRVFDLFGRITYLKASDREEIRAAGLDWLDEDALIRDMHAVVGRRAFVGYGAYRALALRIPWFWPLLPLAYLPPITWLGNAIYRRVADSRLCSVAQLSSEAAPARTPSGLRPVVVVACLILLPVLFFGARKNTSWPFASYPTFAVRAVETKQLMTLGITYGDGRTVELPLAAEARYFPTGPERVAGMTTAVLLLPEGPMRDQVVRDFWDIFAHRDPSLRDAQTVRFYKDYRSVIPERRGDPPVERQLLLELTPG